MIMVIIVATFIGGSRGKLLSQEGASDQVHETIGGQEVAMKEAEAKKTIAPKEKVVNQEEQREIEPLNAYEQQLVFIKENKLYYKKSIDDDQVPVFITDVTLYEEKLCDNRLCFSKDGKCLYFFQTVNNDYTGTLCYITLEDLGEDQEKNKLAVHEIDTNVHLDYETFGKQELVYYKNVESNWYWSDVYYFNGEKAQKEQPRSYLVDEYVSRGRYRYDEQEGRINYVKEGEAFNSLMSFDTNTLEKKVIDEHVIKEYYVDFLEHSDHIIYYNKTSEGTALCRARADGTVEEITESEISFIGFDEEKDCVYFKQVTKEGDTFYDHVEDPYDEETDQDEARISLRNALKKEPYNHVYLDIAIADIYCMNQGEITKLIEGVSWDSVEMSSKGKCLVYEKRIKETKKLSIDEIHSVEEMRIWKCEHDRELTSGELFIWKDGKEAAISMRIIERDISDNGRYMILDDENEEKTIYEKVEGELIKRECIEGVEDYYWLGDTLYYRKDQENREKAGWQLLKFEDGKVSKRCDVFDADYIMQYDDGAALFGDKENSLKLIGEDNKLITITEIPKVCSYINEAHIIYLKEDGGLYIFGRPNTTKCISEGVSQYACMSKEGEGVILYISNATGCYWERLYK